MPGLIDSHVHALYPWQPRAALFDVTTGPRCSVCPPTAGVPLLAGTDAVPIAGHGVTLHWELELLVEAGLAPAEALAAATSVPARCFGLVDRGRIAHG